MFSNFRGGAGATPPPPLESALDRRPVALAKVSVPTHHISLFRVPWHLNYSRPEYS